MEINLKDHLRTLRQQKGITQETLAKHLGITPQSVGKWERGEGFPDITLLPNIALYFGVSIDALLGVGEMQIENAIEAYKTESARLKHRGAIAENIALWEKAAMEFPNDCRVMAGWMDAISAKAIWPCPKEDAEQIIRLGKRILAESTDTGLREDAIQRLCYTYKSIGEEETALHYAQMGGSIHGTFEGLSAFVLDGESGVAATQQYLVSLLFAAALAASSLPAKTVLSTREEIQAYQFGIDLLKLLFSDDNAGFYANELARLYAATARVYAKENNGSNTLTALEDCVRYAKIAANEKDTGNFQNIGNAGSSDIPSIFYTAPMVNRLKKNPENTVKNYEGNACNLQQKELEWSGYDFIRNDKRFAQIKERLAQGAEKGVI